LRIRVDEAAAIIWTMTSGEVHYMLRENWSWTAVQYESWLRDALTAALLD